MRFFVGLQALLAAGTMIALSARGAPALAQVTFGSPGDPPRVALETGVFDGIAGHHPDSRAAGYFGAEYRFGEVAYAIAPFVGVQGTTDAAGYAYFGLGFDINFGSNWVLTPSAAAGIFERGDGLKLGSWWEYRTGAELDYRLPDQSRVGVAFHHMSNAGLTHQNPGEESVLFVYTVPLR